MDVPTVTELHLTDASIGQPLLVRPRRVILAGYTGRDQEQVRRHIEELREQGIPAPERTPETYSVDPGGLQIGGRLASGEGWSSGEIEFVLYEVLEGTYVGVGSDHTDRMIERTSFVASKRAFPKIVSAEVWPVTALESAWDRIVLRSWITADGVRTVYQESLLAAILRPNDLLRLVPSADRGDGLVLFSGTVPAVGPPPETGSCRFEGHLTSPEGATLAGFAYDYEAGPRSPHH